MKVAGVVLLLGLLSSARSHPGLARLVEKWETPAKTIDVMVGKSKAAVLGLITGTNGDGTKHSGDHGSSGEVLKEESYRSSSTHTFSTDTESQNDHRGESSSAEHGYHHSGGDKGGEKHTGHGHSQENGGQSRTSTVYKKMVIEKVTEERDEAENNGGHDREEKYGADRKEKVQQEVKVDKSSKYEQGDGYGSSQQEQKSRRSYSEEERKYEKNGEGGDYDHPERDAAKTHSTSVFKKTETLIKNEGSERPHGTGCCPCSEL